jgi:hypothetical protein
MDDRPTQTHGWVMMRCIILRSALVCGNRRLIGLMIYLTRIRIMGDDRSRNVWRVSLLIPRQTSRLMRRVMYRASIGEARHKLVHKAQVCEATSDLL